MPHPIGSETYLYPTRRQLLSITSLQLPCGTPIGSETHLPCSSLIESEIYISPTGRQTVPCDCHKALQLTLKRLTIHPRAISYCNGVTCSWEDSDMILKWEIVLGAIIGDFHCFNWSHAISNILSHSDTNTRQQPDQLSQVGPWPCHDCKLRIRLLSN